MDALLVFDPQNNLISIKSEKQFSDYLYDFAVENGFSIEVKPQNNYEVLRDLLSVLVTPFVVSHRYLSDVSDIKFDCIGNMSAVYSKNQEFFVLYIHDKNENQVLMQRRVNLFAQIIQFIFGPVIQCITNYHKLTEIAFKMIDEWMGMNENMTFMLEWKGFMYQNYFVLCSLYLYLFFHIKIIDLKFQNQSIERLLVGTEVKSLSNNTLKQIFRRIALISKLSAETPSHIYLFYGLKYITSYSSGHSVKISRGDMVLMLLLSHVIHKYSVPDVIEVNGKSEKIKSFERKQSIIFDKSFSANSFTKFINNSFKKDETKCNQYLVFLQSSNDSKVLIPYIYRTLTIEENLFIIILSEVPTQIAYNLIIIINIINALVNERNERKCCHTVIQLQNSIKRIKDYMFKENLTKERPYISTLNNLIRLSNCKIFQYLTDLDQNLLNFQTEAQLSVLNNSFRDNYKELIFDFYNNLMIKVQSLVSNIFNEVVFHCKKTFSDYLCYFKVKTQRNMTLLALNVDIQDLIAFLYIDRTINEVIIAPIECNDNYSPENTVNVGLDDLNNVFVGMVYKTYFSLMDGKLLNVWTDGVFQYSYVIWFEDSSGSALTSRANHFKLKSYPSIISGNFIQDIITTIYSKESKSERKCKAPDAQKPTISCYPYELFCIYKSSLILSEDKVIENTKKLSTKLWEIGISSDI